MPRNQTMLRCWLLIAAWIYGVQAYITDLKLVICENPELFACARNPGYMRIPVNLNAGTRLESVFLDLKDDPSSDPITDITIVSAKDEKPGNTWTRLDGDLNQGGPEDAALYLYYTKDRKTSRNPINSIIAKKGSHPVVSADYVRVPVDLNQGVGGESVYLFYSQDGSKGISVLKITRVYPKPSQKIP